MRRNLYQQPRGSLEIIPTYNRNNTHALDIHADIALQATLSYINQILLEEDIDEKDTLSTEQSALYQMEKPLYDIIGQKYPSETIVENPPSFHHIGTKGKVVSFPQVPMEDDLLKLNLDIDGDKKSEDSMGSKSMGKNKSNVDLDILEGRTRKMSTPFSEEPPQNEMLDEVLLIRGNYTAAASLQESTECTTSQYCNNAQVGFIDVKALLIECSHAVYANDRQLAEDLINQIRELSSLEGDGIQRMASAFVDALESRLNGIGREAWRQLAGRIPPSEFLKIAKLFMTVCPFPRVSSHFANQTILKVAGKTSKLHIIDFGIGLGFQWPSLIQALSKSNSDGKPIKLKITGIDFPVPGFRPAELIQTTGRRLEAYAESFGVPFEYHGIASKWEEISLDALRIKEDEVVIVNCMFRLKEVGDEAVSLDSPRNRVLKLIWQIQPQVFLHGIVNVGTFSPFFISRFKQVLTLYSALYEIIDTLIPRDNKQRLSLERGVLVGEILNVVACEGSDWKMRPETYKQWRLRNLRAGFEQIPLDPVLLKECQEIKGSDTNNNIFFIDDDKNWLLQGWSARVFYAISTWKAKIA